jgi:hypothetical protein
MAEFAPARDLRAPRVVSATRRCRNRYAGRNGFGYFCRNKSSPLAAEASGTRTPMPLFEWAQANVSDIITFNDALPSGQ